MNGAGRRFGIGGIGRVGDTDVPLSPDLIYAQYARLGATAALVSRAFLRPDPGAVDLVAEVALARERLAHWFRRPARDLLQSRDQLTAAAAGSPRW